MKLALAVAAIVGAFSGGSAIAAWASPAQAPTPSTPSTTAPANPGTSGSSSTDNPNCPNMGFGPGSSSNSGATNSSYPMTKI